MPADTDYSLAQAVLEVAEGPAYSLSQAVLEVAAGPAFSVSQAVLEVAVEWPQPGGWTVGAVGF